MIDDDTFGFPVWIPEASPSASAFIAPTFQPVPIVPAIAVCLATWYAVSFIRARRRGKVWPSWRLASFLIGSTLMFCVTGLGIEGYGYRMLSVFMFQQLTLMMVIPVLLVLGSPGRLLLTSAGSHSIDRVVRVVALSALRSPLTKLLLHPFFLAVLFLFSFYGVYFTGLGSTLLASWLGHLALELFYLTAGILLAIPLASADPLPVRARPLGKVIALLVELPLHALFGVAVMLSTVPLLLTAFPIEPGWDLDPMTDQWIAGALAWTYGELPALIVIVVMLSRWERDDTRRARAADTRRDQIGDPDLDAYNAYLAQLRNERS